MTHNCTAQKLRHERKTAMTCQQNPDSASTRSHRQDNRHAGQSTSKARTLAEHVKHQEHTCAQHCMNMQSLNHCIRACLTAWRWRHTFCPHPGTGASGPLSLGCAIALALHVALARAAFHEAEIILLRDGKMPQHLPPTLQHSLVELKCALAPRKVE